LSGGGAFPRAQAKEGRDAEEGASVTKRRRIKHRDLKSSVTHVGVYGGCGALVKRNRASRRACPANSGRSNRMRGIVVIG
jgi:hypothetical protein